jgi:hypothetical protein
MYVKRFMATGKPDRAVRGFQKGTIETSSLYEKARYVVV